MQEGINDSVYVKWIKNHQGLIAFCAFLSIFLTLLTYPGVMYSDSYIRLSTASDLKTNVKHLINGEQNNNPVYSWLTVVPSFFILFFREISGNIALYTFIQCFFFLLSVYVFNDLISPKKNRILNRIILTLMPVILGFGVFYEPGVGTATAMLAMVVLLWRLDKIRTKFDKLLTALLLVAMSFICFGYRTSALTIVPVLFVIIFLKERIFFKRIILMASLSLGILLTVFIPKILNIDTMSSYTASFIWEMVSVIQEIPKERRGNYEKYFDDVFGDGVTQRALKINNLYQEGSSVNPILWGGAFDVNHISNQHNTKRVMAKYWKLIKNEPLIYLKIKQEMMYRTLGINQPLDIRGYIYNYGNKMSTYGFNDSQQRSKFIDYVNQFMLASWLTKMPWMIFVLVLGLILIKRYLISNRPRSSIAACEIGYVVAICYYGAFFLNTQAFEFRYFFPAWLLLMIILISLSVELLCDTTQWIKIRIKTFQKNR